MNNYEFLTMMREFLLSAPSSGEITPLTMIDYGMIVSGQDSDMNADGNALMLAGDSFIALKTDILGNETHNKRVNFNLIMRRFANSNDLRNAAGNYQMWLISWINEQQALRKTSRANPALPIFGDNPYAEVITADGGIRTANLDEGGVIRSEFSVQIHVDYQKKYKVK